MTTWQSTFWAVASGLWPRRQKIIHDLSPYILACSGSGLHTVFMRQSQAQEYALYSYRNLSGTRSFSRMTNGEI